MKFKDLLKLIEDLKGKDANKADAAREQLKAMGFTDLDD